MKRPRRQVVFQNLFLWLFLSHNNNNCTSNVVVKAFAPRGLRSTASSLTAKSKSSSFALPKEKDHQHYHRQQLQAAVDDMRAEAERARHEAKLMEQHLTITKIERLEEKLRSKHWIAKHPDQTEDLERQLEALQRKLGENPSFNNNRNGVTFVKKPVEERENITVEANHQDVAVDEPRNGVEEESYFSRKEIATPSSSSSSTSYMREKSLETNPICGFDQEDLELFLPVAYKIEANMPNNTTEQKLMAFRSAPELEEHFEKKIRDMVLKPMEDMQKLEELRSQFLSTRSRVEKENIRRQITQMEKDLEKDGPFGYSDCIFLDIPPMPDEEMQERLEAVGILPSVLQGLYTRRTKAADGDIRLAIELDHYEAQVQLLEQIKYVEPWTEKEQEDAVKAIESLPMSIRNHIAADEGLGSGENAEELLQALLHNPSESGIKEFSNMQELVVSAGASSDDHDDLNYIDRSRYAEEFYPAIARLEGKHPTAEEMDSFITEVVDRRAFMVRSRPERVVGGWYVRGDNLLSEDQDGTKLVKCLMERLEVSPKLADRIEFFFVPDPSPQADEDFEGDVAAENILYVTAKDPATFYNNSKTLTKLSVSSLGFVAMGLFSLATVEMVPALRERMDNALDPVATGGADLEWLTNTATPVFLSMLAIFAMHELGHVTIALKDKFKIGFGTPIASVQTGFQGSITPLESPPPGMKSLFDFALAGPMMGFLSSLAFFVVGLQETANVSMNTSLDFPGLPIFLLRSSALGCGLIEFFLGKGTLLPGVELPTETVLSLHPYAISGFIGLLANSLALLPLGNTDGGRIAITMFGRRGAYLVSAFTAVLLCLTGLFGLDESRIFLTYTIFTIIWQRELETPARNEVEELDFTRGVMGIIAALFVGLTLCPFL